MAKLDVLDLNAKKVGEVELADSVWNIEVNNQAIFDALMRQQSSWRQGTHDVKNKGEVSGGGKKPFRQKGTGRARQGSSRAVQYVGGGVAFGPTPRKYITKLNRKVRKLALKSALTLKAQNNNLVVVENMEMPEIKTSVFAKILKVLGIERKALFVVSLEENFDNAYMSMRNIGSVGMVSVEGLNIYDLQNANKLVCTTAAIKQIEEVFKGE